MMQLTVIKDQLIKEDARFLQDNTYFCEVSLESVKAEYRNVFASLHSNKKKPPKGSVMLVATPSPKEKKLRK
jgi:hypothetical protein